MHQYRLPEGMRYSTVDERREFYENEFDLKKVEGYMSALPNAVYALILGRHTQIVPDKYKDKVNHIIRVDKCKDMQCLLSNILEFLPESVYYDRNIYSDPAQCKACSKKR